MLVLLESIVLYLVVSMPGVGYLLTQVERSKPKSEENIPENIKIWRYYEFSNLWQVLFAESCRTVAMIVIINTGNIILLTFFLLGLAYGVWDRNYFREESLYLAISLLVSNVWIGGVYLVFLLLIRKNNSMRLIFNTIFTFMFALGLWAFNSETALISIYAYFFVYCVVKFIVVSFGTIQSSTRLRANKV